MKHQEERIPLSPTIERGSMRVHSEQLEYVHRQVARGEYRVNSERVAAAMLQRIGANVLDRELITVPDADRARPPALSALRGV